MKIKFLENGHAKEISLKEPTPIRTLINNFHLNDETFLIKLNGKIAHEETELKEGDELEFLDVIYGG
ncbi:MAG TPA: MoaD/ThiS family protein [Candidatus Norongarragalinales archaeon]|nr:MoaD/ThiS family protein [Candidatus Norongarragalinales archaeon]